MIKESIKISIFQKLFGSIRLDLSIVICGTDHRHCCGTKYRNDGTYFTRNMYVLSCLSERVPGSILSRCVAGYSGIQCKHRKYVVNQGWDELHLG